MLGGAVSSDNPREQHRFRCHERTPLSLRLADPPRVGGDRLSVAVDPVQRHLGPHTAVPWKTWESSKLYVLQPFAKRGEMDQGILRFTWTSLVLVAKGYAIALLIGTPLGFVLGMSKFVTRAFDPIIQVLRPVSPLAWLPLGIVLFQKSEPSAIFTIAVCAMWPTC